MNTSLSRYRLLLLVALALGALQGRLAIAQGMDVPFALVVHDGKLYSVVATHRTFTPVVALLAHDADASVSGRLDLATPAGCSVTSVRCENAWMYLTLTVPDGEDRSAAEVHGIPLSLLTDVELVPAARTVQLHAVYPNPAMRSMPTQVQVDAVRPLHVSLELCTTLGRSVQRTELWLREGRNSIALDTSVLPSGLYLCILKTAGESLAQTAVLVLR